MISKIYNLRISENSGFYLIGNNPQIIKAPMEYETKLLETLKNLKTSFNKKIFFTAANPDYCKYCQFIYICRKKFYTLTKK